MALRDWIQNDKFEEEPPAKIAKIAKIPEKKAENSKNSKLSKGEPLKLKHSAPVDYDREIMDVINEFDEAGVLVMAASPEIRQQTWELEEELTEAANNGDVTRFRQLLHRWRLAWLRTLH